MVRIALCCGTGIATSTAVRKKVEDEMNKRGYKGKYTITQCKVGEAVSQSKMSDLVVSTVASTLLTNNCECPVIIATGILMNRGVQEIYDSIEKVIKEKMD